MTIEPPEDTSQSVLRRLQLIRASLAEANVRARPSAQFVDRMIAILLAGQAVELSLIVALGREFQIIRKALDEAEAQHGPLSTRVAAEAVWRARVGVQHTGVVPDATGAGAVVVDARAFCAELILRSHRIRLERITLASLVDLPDVRAALLVAERAIEESDARAATVALARSWARLLTAASIFAEVLHGRNWGFSGYLDVNAVRREWADDGGRVLSPQLVRWVENATDSIHRLQIRDLLALRFAETRLISETLPDCLTNMNRQETVTLWTDQELASIDDLRQILTQITDAAIELGANRTNMDEWEAKRLDVRGDIQEVVREVERPRPG